MFKLVVLFAFASVVVAKPSGVALGHLEYAAPVSVSSAQSHSYRKDVISEPAIVATPVVAEVRAAPVVAHSAPVYASSSSHQYRKDIISEPTYTYAHAAPVVTEVHAAPVVAEVRAAPVIAHAAPVVSSSSSHQYRKDIISEPTYTYAHAAPVATEVHAAPVVAEVRAAPVIAHAAPVVSSSSSHQYRKDVISEPTYTYAQAAPVVAELHAAPVVTEVRAAPVIAHSAPVVSSSSSHQYRKDIISEPTYTYAHAAPVVTEVHAAPVVAEVHAAPVIAHAAPVVSSSSSHQYRKDVISEPTYTYAQAAPVVTEVHAAPVVAEVRAAPVTAYAAPAVSSSSSHSSYRKDVISEPAYVAHAAPALAYTAW